MCCLLSDALKAYPRTTVPDRPHRFASDRLDRSSADRSSLQGMGASSPRGVRRHVTCSYLGLRSGSGSSSKATGSMKTARTMANKQADSGAMTGYEAKLWAMADTLRGSMDAAEYKHVVLGLVFLKYILGTPSKSGTRQCWPKWGEEAAEDRDEYIAENIFWVPQEARWPHLKAWARQPTIGQTVDQAMTAVERDNPVLKEVSPHGLRAARPRQATPRPTHRHDQQHPRRGRRSPIPGRAGTCLRVLPLTVRQCRGQEGRRVLHTALRRQAPGRDARTLPRAGLRSLLRVLGDVRAIGGVHSSSRQRQRQRRQGAG